MIFLKIYGKAIKTKKRGQTGKKNRDYLKPESKKNAISRNRIEIYNLWSFSEGLTPGDFIRGKGQSILRNPLLADVLFKSKEIEKWRSGLKRICEECLEYGVKIEFEILKTGNRITELVYENPSISISKLVRITGLSRQGVAWNIGKLKEKGIRKRVGPAKGGHWQVIEQGLQ